MIKTVLFDVDGTILDTEFVMIKSLQKTLKEEKNLDVPEENLEYILGIPGKKAIERYSSSGEEVDKLHACWSEHVKQYSHLATLFPQVEEALTKLKENEIQIGIVTSKTNEEMENEFEHFGLSKLFDISVTASDTTKHKPNPEPILYALNKLGSLPEETIYIGDSIYDMHSSQSAGAKFALAKWGAKENPLFSSADIRLETPLEILQHLK
ncbi:MULTISPECIES: HAD family hydrolase [Enterococcus]|uniref:HAD family hydrolase n=1 Tax=Enterococcus TaxID=1350 RepID=UPI000CF62FD5|nr:HAD family hydrolase [Enterococcus faecalis]EGO2721869.1 HAD family hydrolase [Enterococcus faecalis]EGO5237140.1 HAD family hydrolase [Enterococcus faecalis]EGO5968242.1 HAD family hydrolase [Enterococcus faecalis]EGO8341041.1 HAD family hydrolase [Enterococcus faecalis]EHU9669005.1 HAD family hydrolase [Enterococcus faecalis]